MGEDAGCEDVSRTRGRLAAPAQQPSVLRQRPSGSRPAAVPHAHADPRRHRRGHARRDCCACAHAEGRLGQVRVIVIHRGINRLYLYDGARLVRVFPVATGQAAWPTPLGQFQIVVKQKNPWWFPPTQDSWAAGAKPVPPGPDNPLGTRWMGLSVSGVGIHGTDEPWSIGHSESHGCIRMQVASAEWLFNRVRVGTPVFIIPA
jgi:hypothetical protein